MRKGNFDFCKNSKFFALFVALVYVVVIVLMCINGIGVDIKFTGGALLKYSYEGGTLSLEDVDKLAEDVLGREVTVQRNTDSLGKETLSISVGGRADLVAKKATANGSGSSAGTEADAAAINVKEEAKLLETLREKYPDITFENAGTNSVSASMGKEFLIQSLIAVGIAVVLMLVYVAIRFRKIGGWRAGLCSVVSLIVSLTFVYSTFIIMGVSLNENFIAVLLTILGYAINDTIIVYDRIRENREKIGRGKVDYTKLVNESENQTLTRTVNTTITTAIAIGTVAVMAVIFKIDSIISFAFPMLVGILVGTCCTLFVSGPLWVKLQKKN